MQKLIEVEPKQLSLLISNTDIIDHHVLTRIPSRQALAISVRDICSVTGFTPREVKEAVKRLRGRYPICAKIVGGGGYWMAENELDIQNFIRLIKRRMETFEVTIAKMNDHLQDLEAVQDGHTHF